MLSCAAVAPLLRDAEVDPFQHAFLSKGVENVDDCFVVAWDLVRTGIVFRADHDVDVEKVTLGRCQHLPAQRFEMALGQEAKARLPLLERIIVGNRSVEVDLPVHLALHAVERREHELVLGDGGEALLLQFRGHAVWKTNVCRGLKCSIYWHFRVDCISGENKSVSRYCVFGLLISKRKCFLSPSTPIQCAFKCYDFMFQVM